MRHFNLFIHSLLLLTTPSLSLYPHSSLSEATTSTHPFCEKWRNPLKNLPILTYDEFLGLFDAIEHGELEEQCTEEEIENIIRFIAYLASQKIYPLSPEEQAILDHDIQELLYGEGDEEEEESYSFAIQEQSAYPLVFTVSYEAADIILCKTWVTKKLKQTKKFIKKHKKAVIITAVAVVAVVVVVATVGTAAPALTAAASAAGAACRCF
jgi:hypothetical protein